MACGRSQHLGVDVFPEHHLSFILAVKEKNEINLRMRAGDPLQGLKGKPANTIQLPGHQEPGIYSYCALLVLLVQNIPE